MKRKNFICLLTLLVIGVNGCILAQSRYPKYETRAVWLTTIGGLDWPHSYSQSPRSEEKQKRELVDILDQLVAANINTILLQTRVRATTIYPSLIEPWDGCLSGFPGKSPGYDALAFAIDECHKRGIELHAWIVAMPVGSWNGLGCATLRKRYPHLVKRIGNDGYMNPEAKETAQYIANICKEITSRYDIDGIHLDYIRYPEAWNINVSRSTARDNITHIVEAVSREVKGLKPWVKMSCSPIGKYDDLARYWSHGWNANTRTCQDAQGWMRTGLMDIVFPMMYFRGDQFYPFAIDWIEHNYGKTVVAGLGAYMLSPKESNWSIDEIVRQIAFSRSIGMGQAFFRSKFFTDNTKGIYDYARNIAYPYLALTPPIHGGTIPSTPTGLRVERRGMNYLIEWEAVPHTLYNIYMSSDDTVDISNPQNLIAVRLRGSSLVVNAMGKKSFAITAVNRYGNESKAAIASAPYTKGKIFRMGILSPSDNPSR